MKKSLLVLLSLSIASILVGCNGGSNNDVDNRTLVNEECSFLNNLDDVWQPVWCDEFNTDGAVDSSKWLFDVGGSGWGNNEAQYYTDNDLDNAHVEDGSLFITAINEPYGGKNYTSARMVTKYQGDWQYGRIQVKAKLPVGSGTWPAIWMLPTEWRYGGWPDSGEIDIMEHVGRNQNNIFGTIHTGAYNHSLGTQIGFDKTVDTASTDFHVYEMIWEPGYINLYIDGELFAYFGYNPLTNIDTENSDAWPFDQPFHLILNLAIGGNFGGSYIDSSVFPQSLEVDYVRVYQKDYAGLDKEKPGEVTNVTIQKSNYNSAKISWDKTTDDVAIEKYAILVDNIEVGTTTVNAFLIEDLSPNSSYTINVKAIDFDGNYRLSDPLALNTDELRSQVGRIEAEDYDNMFGVDTEVTSDTEGLINVGWIHTNDYLEYMINVTEAGTYKVVYRVASPEGAELKLYGKTIVPLTTTVIPATGDWQNWIDVETSEFTLIEGAYTFKISASIGGLNINYFEFEKVE